MLYDHNTSKNPDFTYWNYQQFDLEDLSHEKCKAEFRFYKNNFTILEYFRKDITTTKEKERYRKPYSSENTDLR